MFAKPDFPHIPFYRHVTPIHLNTQILPQSPTITPQAIGRVGGRSLLGGCFCCVCFCCIYQLYWSVLPKPHSWVEELRRRVELRVFLGPYDSMWLCTLPFLLP